MLQRLAPDLVARLDEDWQEFEREPKTLTVRWRARGNGWRYGAGKPCRFPMSMVIIIALQVVIPVAPQSWSPSLFLL